MSRALRTIEAIAEKHGYRIDTPEFMQRRSVGRSALVPTINLSKFTVRAKIDTLVVRAAFESHKQARHIANNLA
jgi:hypothetical protein